MTITKRTLLAITSLVLLTACKPVPKPAAAPSALTAVRFATDWRAEAEHGGYYQALATGEYARRGLNVTFYQGGPAVNVPQLLATGAVDVGIGSNSFVVMNLAAVNAPVKAVAAFMQKDPQVLMVHPGAGINTIADLKNHPILLADESVTAFWVWLKAKYGFTDSQVRKYTFNSAPFLADKRAAQQGYVTSEPYTIAKVSGTPPRVFLLADEGYPSYADIVMVPDSFAAAHPEAVRAFVESSAAGWLTYLYGDPAPGDALIRKDNPEMAQDVLDQAREKMRTYNIVGKPGEIGQMSDARWKTFFDAAVSQGVYPKTLDYKAAYRLDFLPKRSAPTK